MRISAIGRAAGAKSGALMAALTVLVVGLAASSAPAVRPSGVTSAYSKLDIDRCPVVRRGEEEIWLVWRCPGYGQIAVFVTNDDERFDLDAGVEQADGRFSASMNMPPDTIEWRLRNGRPFAMIYRLRATSSSADSRLIVETIGRGKKPGCRVAEIPANSGSANARARRIADQILTGKAGCLAR